VSPAEQHHRESGGGVIDATKKLNERIKILIAPLRDGAVESRWPCGLDDLRGPGPSTLGKNATSVERMSIRADEGLSSRPSACDCPISVLRALRGHDSTYSCLFHHDWAERRSRQLAHGINSRGRLANGRDVRKSPPACVQGPCDSRITPRDP